MVSLVVSTMYNASKGLFRDLFFHLGFIHFYSTSIDESKSKYIQSTSKLGTLIQNSGLPAEQVYKMICLPAVADLEGTPLLVPRSTSNIHELLSTLGGGTCIQCENEAIMEAMMVSTCMMGPVYGLMRTNRDFLIKNGVPPKDANHVVARQYWGMTKDALVRCEGGDGDNEDAHVPGYVP